MEQRAKRTVSWLFCLSVSSIFPSNWKMEMENWSLLDPRDQKYWQSMELQHLLFNSWCTAWCYDVDCWQKKKNLNRVFEKLAGFKMPLKVFCLVSSALCGLCSRKQFAGIRVLLLQLPLLLLSRGNAVCLCKSQWFSNTWCLLLFFSLSFLFFFLDKPTLINSVCQACLKKSLRIYHSSVDVIYFSQNQQLA